MSKRVWCIVKCDPFNSVNKCSTTGYLNSSWASCSVLLLLFTYIEKQNSVKLCKHTFWQRNIKFRRQLCYNESALCSSTCIYSSLKRKEKRNDTSALPLITRYQSSHLAYKKTIQLPKLTLLGTMKSWWVEQKFREIYKNVKKKHIIVKRTLCHIFIQENQNKLITID